MKALLSSKAAAKFRRKARLVYPLEEFGILLGDLLPDGVLVKDIYFPPDRLEESTENDIEICADWYEDATDWSKERGDNLVVLGDIHSHCYKNSDDYGREYGTETSPEDLKHARSVHERHPTYCINGVCLVLNKAGKKRTSIKLWPLTQPVKTTMVMEKEEE